jgi:hypothetical protein
MHTLRTRVPTTVTRLPLVALVIAVGAAGCAPLDNDGESLGDLGLVGFGYDQSCFFECPIEQPLLVGAKEKIQVTGPGDDAGIVASTPNEDIVDLAMERDCFCEREDGNPGQLDIAKDATCPRAWKKHCDNIILVEAKKAGDARLELHSELKRLVDSVRLHVREADRAAFFATYMDRLGTLEAEDLDLAEGEKVELEVELYDEDGLVLLAPGGVSWSVGDESVAIVSAWLVGMGKEVEAGLGVSIEAKAAGATDVTVTVPGLESSIPLTVTK